MTDVEFWVPCPDYEAEYEVSSLGTVRSVDRLVYDQATGRPRRRRSQEMKQCPSGKRNPYLTCGLSRNGRRRTVRIHVLVCNAFHGPKPSTLHEVRHINGDLTDNRAANLAWGSHSDNMRDKVAHGTHHFANKTHCPRGHAYAGDNLYMRRSGGRQCRTCARRFVREHRQRIAQGAVA